MNKTNNIEIMLLEDMIQLWYGFNEPDAEIFVDKLINRYGYDKAVRMIKRGY